MDRFVIFGFLSSRPFLFWLVVFVVNEHVYRFGDIFITDFYPNAERKGTKTREKFTTQNTQMKKEIHWKLDTVRVGTR